MLRQRSEFVKTAVTEVTIARDGTRVIVHGLASHNQHGVTGGRGKVLFFSKLSLQGFGYNQRQC